MFNLKSKAREVIERGYCVLESVYDDREREQMHTIFKQLCDDKNGFSSEQPTISFHPLLEWGPKMAPFFAKAVVVDAMAEVFQDDVRLAHSGAAVFKQRTRWRNPHPLACPLRMGDSPDRASTGESGAVALQHLRGRIQLPHWTSHRSTTRSQRFSRSKGRCWGKMGWTGGGRGSAGISGHL